MGIDQMSFSKEELTLTGTIDSIIFQNEENGYTVCELATEDAHVTLVGCLPYCTEGDSLKVYGQWAHHKEYGEQFKVSAFEKRMPQTRASILAYLSSGVVKGIGPATAKRIVERFGEQSLEVIEQAPDRLAELKGISAKKAREIKESYDEKQAMQSIVLFLQQYGISLAACAKIYRQYGALAVNLIQNNPFILCRDISGIGFQTADKLAIALGKAGNDIDRVSAGILYLLSRASQGNGYTYLKEQELLFAAKKELNVGEEEVRAGIHRLLLSKDIVLHTAGERSYVYLRELYQAEREVAQQIALRAAGDTLFDENEVDELIMVGEYASDLLFAEQQKTAIRNALLYQISVITGGPGTGKTTIINTVIRILEKKGHKVLLTAPTGRAAKRMSDICIKEAKTIHRLLEAGYRDDSDALVFHRNEENLLDADVIIVDEMSMVDIQLMASLLKAVKNRTQLILVGDADQLPSVGPGNVLRDIIGSGKVKVTSLTEIFRQAQESLIVMNAHRVNRGELPLCNQKDKDFFMIPAQDAADTAKIIVSLYKDRFPKTYGKEFLEGVQVLSPMRKGDAGVTNLNRLLQEALNPPSPNKPQRHVRDMVFRTGDKVMQIKNNYELEFTRREDGQKGSGVFNGDMGVVYEISEKQERLTVLFDDDKLVQYDFGQLDELELSYAVTIHKSQGSEYRAVVLSLFKGPDVLFTRNLIYTAITRAKELVVLVGSYEAMRRMVENEREVLRNSSLDERIAEAF